MARIARIAPIAVVALSALAGGSALCANAVISRFAAPPHLGAVALAVARPPAVPARAPALSLSKEQHIDGIMSRNLFDASSIATWTGGTPGAPAIGLRLLTAYVADPEAFSRAMIDDGSSTELYALGDMLRDREVISIADERVGLKKRDGTIEYIALEAGTAGLGEPVAPIEASGEAVEGVSRDGDRYVVSRELFDQTIGDLGKLSQLGRVQTHAGPDGRVDGYRLSAIRRNTLADQLGIKNGDIVRSVNGQPLDSAQAAMNAYDTMRSGSSFCFEITRRGSPQELCYDVR